MKLRVLLIEDNPSDVILIKRKLKSRWNSLTLESILCKSDYIDKLQNNQWDVIISDYSLPQFDGITALKLLDEMRIDLPFIMVSGVLSEKAAEEILSLGAKDYILKENLDRLVQVIEREIKECSIRKQNRQNEIALANSELAWETTFSAIADSIILLDSQGKIRHFNEAARKLFNKTKEEFIGSICWELFDIPDEEKESCPFYLMKKSMKREIVEIFYEDRLYEVTIDPVLSPDNKLVSAVHITKDITKRLMDNRLQKTLYKISTAGRNSKDVTELFTRIRVYLSKIINTDSIFVALYDKDRNYFSLPYYSDPEENISEFPAGKTLTNHLYCTGKAALFSEDEINRLVETGKIEIVGKPARQWMGVPLRSSKRDIGVLSVQSYDISNLLSEKDLKLLTFVSNEIANAIERKQAEESLRAANAELKEMHHGLELKVKEKIVEIRDKDHIIMEKSRQAAVAEILSLLAHHWRQPLNSIGVTIQALQEAEEFGELTQEYLNEKTKTALTTLKRLSGTIDEFRFLYEIDSESSEFDVKECLKKLIKLNKEKFDSNKIKLQTDLGKSYFVKGYSNYCSQAVMNVLTNSYDILRARKIEDPRIWLKYYTTADSAVISIKDNAGGVDKKIEETLFDLYTSTKKDLNNTGLGLYITRLIIRNMNGYITLINHPEGAEFVITIQSASPSNLS